MLWFRKKKIYRITWRYVGDSGRSYTAIVKGYDTADAWKRLSKQHAYVLDCIELEELN